MLRKTVIPIPPAIRTSRRDVSSGRPKSPFGCSTSTSVPTGSSPSVRLKALSRILVARPRTPFSFGDVTKVMCLRSPFSSWWPASGSVTKKYWPGLKSTSSPRRSKVTSSVPLATSCFSLICARISLDAHGSQEDEHDGGDGEQTVSKPQSQEHESAARGDDPADERGPVHLNAPFSSRLPSHPWPKEARTAEL